MTIEEKERPGRQKGTPNKPPLQRIKENRGKLERLLLDKALAGDVDAIKACLELIDDQVEPGEGDDTETESSQG